jgi:luciferase family oxidoreductase group 1
VTSIPLSILDLATVVEGQTSADALRFATRAAQLAEQLDYKRYWVAEHHNFPSVASTSPSVLIAHLASATKTMHIGSGGVMLPNHAPLVVAEQFSMLEALHPGRIDLGIGRAPGTDGRTAYALRRGALRESQDQFPQELMEVMALLGDVRDRDGALNPMSATPVPVGSPNVMLLGSSTFSAQLAGTLGLPFAFAHHFSAQFLDAAIEGYRATFQPSAVIDEPYLIIATAALVADDADEAERLAMPGRVMTVNIRNNRRSPILRVDDAIAHPEAELAVEMSRGRIVGTSDVAVDALQLLAKETGADELMITTVTHGIEERLRSMELLAGAWQRRQVEV